MVVYLCAECEAEISRPVVDLVDRSILREDRGKNIFSNQAGAPDMVPQGFQIDGSTAGYGVSGSREGWPVLNPENLIDTEFDYLVEIGCCGPPGKELNTECPNGHKVAAERADCTTVHTVALDPDSVLAVESQQEETHGLEDANPEVWLDTLGNGSIADQRRAIALLGSHEIEEAVSALRGILENGPTPLRSIAARSLGRIGTPEALDSLTAVMDDDDDSVRETVVMAIGGCDIEGTNKILLDRLVEESTEAVCREIKYGLDRFVSADEYREYIDWALFRRRNSCV